MDRVFDAVLHGSGLAQVDAAAETDVEAVGFADAEPEAAAELHQRRHEGLTVRCDAADVAPEPSAAAELLVEDEWIAAGDERVREAVRRAGHDRVVERRDEIQWCTRQRATEWIENLPVHERQAEPGGVVHVSGVENTERLQQTLLEGGGRIDIRVAVRRENRSLFVHAEEDESSVVAVRPAGRGQHGDQIAHDVLSRLLEPLAERLQLGELIGARTGELRRRPGSAPHRTRAGGDLQRRRGRPTRHADVLAARLVPVAVRGSEAGLHTTALAVAHARCRAVGGGRAWDRDEAAAPIAGFRGVADLVVGARPQMTDAAGVAGRRPRAVRVRPAAGSRQQRCAIDEELGIDDLPGREAALTGGKR